MVCKRKNIIILGSTGSIGQQTLKVIRRNPDRYCVLGLSAGDNLNLLIEQAREFLPPYICVKDGRNIKKIRDSLNYKPEEILSGDKGLSEIAVVKKADMVLVAIVGVTALLPTIKAIEAGKDIALASKEILVAAGHIVMAKIQKHKVNLLPVDSEHSAIFQCLQGNKKKWVEKLVLTASGGPFFGCSGAELEKATMKDALKHPNWNMGKKITIDSATLLNKGLEIIEAHWLFGIGYDDIDVVVHRESIVHSMVMYKDGSMIAQMGIPDMCLPIQYALSYPERTPADWPRVDLVKQNKLTFYAPDKKLFPCLELAYESGRRGGSAPVVLNAANEEAVALFLAGKIKFTDIPRIISRLQDTIEWVSNPDLETVIEIDKRTRKAVGK